MESFSGNYPGIKFRSERPLFRCNYSPSEISSYVPRFGIRFFCDMEFTIAPNGLCGLCPPITSLTNQYGSRPSNTNEFIEIVNVMRNLTKKLQAKPSFEECYTCQHKCQGGCLSYKF